MITLTTTIEIGFFGTTSESVNVYVPFLVDEIRVIDTMYTNNNAIGSNPAYSYLLSSSLFDGLSIPITNPDFINYTPLMNHSQINITYYSKKEINGSYQFDLTFIYPENPLEPTYGVVLLVQFVNTDEKYY